MSDINDLFKSVALPVMPEVGIALINTLDNPKTQLSTIHELISKDPTLTVKLLAMANSAAFGLSGKVATVRVMPSGLARACRTRWMWTARTPGWSV